MNIYSALIIGIGIGLGVVPLAKLIQAWRDYSRTLKRFPLRHPNPRPNQKVDVSLLLKNGTLH